jgi:hypothetical protein
LSRSKFQEEEKKSLEKDNLQCSEKISLLKVFSCAAVEDIS